MHLNIAPCSYEAAEFACRTWHYSAAMPAGKLARFGVWEDGAFIGAVLFGRGASPGGCKQFGLEQTQFCELVRIALTAHQSPVSRIMAICLKVLHRHSPGLRLVVSYADPAKGHYGGVYQACGWVYTGLTSPQTSYMVYGKQIHKRSGNSVLGRKHTLPPSPPSQKHKYLYPLDAEMRQLISSLAQPYPKAPFANSAKPDAPLV